MRLRSKEKIIDDLKFMGFLASVAFGYGIGTFTIRYYFGLMACLVFAFSIPIALMIYMLLFE